MPYLSSLLLRPRFAALMLCLLIQTANTALAAAAPSFETTSRRGLVIAFFPDLNPLGINQMHGWEVTVRDEQGNVVEAAELVLRGGMPEHDHGMPTQPALTAEPRPGRYRLDGLRFHMPGLWRLELDIRTDSFSDSAVIEFRL